MALCSSCGTWIDRDDRFCQLCVLEGLQQGKIAGIVSHIDRTTWGKKPVVRTGEDDRHKSRLTVQRNVEKEEKNPNRAQNMAILSYISLLAVSSLIVYLFELITDQPAYSREITAFLTLIALAVAYIPIAFVIYLLLKKLG